MRKSKKLNNILDECLERLLIKGESIEQCLQSYPEHAEELKPLLDTILSGRRVSDVEPRPEFMARARYQFRLALQEAKAKKSRRFFGWQPAWVTVVAVVLTFVLTSGVTVAAAGDSMPDEPLYPVKVVTEQVQLTVTRSPLSKAELHAKLADRRVAEIVYLANKNKPEAIESTTGRLNTSLLKIAVLSRVQGEVDDRGGVAPSSPGLVSEPARGERAPQMESPKLRRGKVTPQAESAAPSLSEPGPVEVSPEQSRGEPGVGIKQTQRVRDRARLRAVVIRCEKNHPAALRAALEDAPPSVRAALQEAIDISEAGYKEARRALD